jgi:hypothetical protein
MRLGIYVLGIWVLASACSGKASRVDGGGGQKAIGGAGSFAGQKQTGGSGNSAGLAGQNEAGGSDGGGAGQSAGADPGGTGGAGGTGGEGGEGGEAGSVSCDAFEDGAELNLPVVIKNLTAHTIYVEGPFGTCSDPEFFEAFDANDDELSVGTMCINSCAEVRDHDIDFCEPLCHESTLLTLEAGASYSTIWRGLKQEWVAVPHECRAPGLADGHCSVRRSVVPGTVRFSAHGGTQLACQSPGFCTECQPDSHGTCISQDAKPDGALTSADSELEFITPPTGAEPIELKFEDP